MKQKNTLQREIKLEMISFPWFERRGNVPEDMFLDGIAPSKGT
jgi:hypothetical protein